MGEQEVKVVNIEELKNDLSLIFTMKIIKTLTNQLTDKDLDRIERKLISGSQIDPQ